MFSILKITLLGAALATATPIARDAALSQQTTCTVNLEDILPDGTAPFYMAQVSDPATETDLDGWQLCSSKDDREKYGEKCLDGFHLTGDPLDDLIKRLRAANPLIRADSTVFVIEDTPAANETRNASAPALVARQESKCPEACAAWAAIPPFGVWFGVCVGDCHHRCHHGQKCP